MRVGLVCPYTWDVPGGVQQHIRGLAEALLGLGHDVSVLAPVVERGGLGGVPPGGLGGGAVLDPLPPYVVPAGRAFPVPYNGSVARLAFGVRPAGRVRRWLRDGRFDVLHVHQPTAPSLSLLACWIADCPIVATVHTSIAKSRVMTAGSSILHTAMDRLGGMIAVSEDARRTIAWHLGGDAAVIPNGVDTRRFAHAEPLPGWPGTGGALGFLGRLDERRKGLPVLLEAFRLLAYDHPGLRLLLAGPGEGDAARQVRRCLPSDLAGRAAVLGRVSEEDKVRAYHSVDAFVAPNLGGESFGIVLAEAMAAGAPIVASDIGAFRRVLGDGRAGTLFDTGDPAALATAAGGLLDAPSAGAELSARAREVVAGYDWSTVVRDVLGVYEQALDAAHASPGLVAGGQPGS